MFRMFHDYFNEHYKINTKFLVFHCFSKLQQDLFSLLHVVKKEEIGELCGIESFFCIIVKNLL